MLQWELRAQMNAEHRGKLQHGARVNCGSCARQTPRRSPSCATGRQCRLLLSIRNGRHDWGESRRQKRCTIMGAVNKMDRAGRWMASPSSGKNFVDGIRQTVYRHSVAAFSAGDSDGQPTRCDISHAGADGRGCGKDFAGGAGLQYAGRGAHEPGEVDGAGEIVAAGAESGSEIFGGVAESGAAWLAQQSWKLRARGAGAAPRRSCRAIRKRGTTWAWRIRIRRNREAIAAFQHVENMAADEPDAYYLKGFAFAVAEIRRGDSALKKALEIAPYHASAQFGTGARVPTKRRGGGGARSDESLPEDHSGKLGTPFGAGYGDQGKFSLAEFIRGAEGWRRRRSLCTIRSSRCWRNWWRAREKKRQRR